MKTIQLLLLLFTFSTLQAQVKLGAKVGVNLNNIFETEIVFINFPDIRVGYHFGGLAQLQLSNSFFLQPELLYSSKGSSFNENAPFTLEEDYYFNYLNLPLLFGYRSGGLGLLVGPEFGYLLSAKAKGDGYENNVKDTYDMNSFDIGVALGIQYELKMGIGFGARYTRGISNIRDFKVDTGTGEEENGWRNHVIQFYVHYMFASSKE